MASTLPCRCTLLAVLLAALSIAPAFAAYTPVAKFVYVYPAYEGSAQQPTIFRGYHKSEAAKAVYPGVIRFNPPDSTWSNYVNAANESPKVDYTITSVTLKKKRPEYFSISERMPEAVITQSGAANITLTWPLLYEIPGTTWTLTVEYSTQLPYDDDAAGPNGPTTQHTQVWVYYLDSIIPSLQHALAVMHSLPFGAAGSPLVSDESLYPALEQRLELADAAFLDGDLPTSSDFLTDFELEVMDAMTVSASTSLAPTGAGTGVVQTTETPVGEQLLVMAEYMMPGG